MSSKTLNIKIKGNGLIAGSKSLIKIKDENSKNILKRITSADPFESDIEKALLESSIPIEISDAEEIKCLNQRGFWLNKIECLEWSNRNGSTDRYNLNEDMEFEIIHKQNESTVDYNQKVQVKYLRPPTPPPPGELIIRAECNENIDLKRPPPIILRQLPVRSPSPTQPLILREG
jgi:hypothetical protein